MNRCTCPVRVYALSEVRAQHSQAFGRICQLLPRRNLSGRYLLLYFPFAFCFPSVSPQGARYGHELRVFTSMVRQHSLDLHVISEIPSQQGAPGLVLGVNIQPESQNSLVVNTRQPKLFVHNLWIACITCFVLNSLGSIVTACVSCGNVKPRNKYRKRNILWRVYEVI
jgi:hypothetical protein